MEKITISNVRQIADKIIGKLVKGDLAYFNLCVADSSGFSQCFFTPTSKIRGKEQHMIFVGDYEKVICLLLCHPKVNKLEYDNEENAVTAIFDNPYQERLMKMGYQRFKEKSS